MPVLVLDEFERAPIEAQRVDRFAAARQDQCIEEDGGRVLERGINLQWLAIFAAYGAQTSAQESGNRAGVIERFDQIRNRVRIDAIRKQNRYFAGGDAAIAR